MESLAAPSPWRARTSPPSTTPSVLPPFPAAMWSRWWAATNATIAAATVTNTGTTLALNSLRITATSAITLTAGTTLTLTSGGLLSNAATAVTSITGGTGITSGTSELNVYNNGTGAGI